MISSPEADFLALGGEGPEVCRFAWHVDADTLREVNSALGFDGEERHARGFLSRLMAAWLRLPPGTRPSFHVMGTLPDDLAFLPSPRLLLARSTDGDRWQGWYTTSSETDAEAIFEGRVGTLLFSVEGVPAAASRELSHSLRSFQLTRWNVSRGMTMYRRRPPVTTTGF